MSLLLRMKNGVNHPTLVGSTWNLTLGTYPAWRSIPKKKKNLQNLRDTCTPWRRP
jgi:hypothetical protein